MEIVQLAVVKQSQILELGESVVRLRRWVWEKIQNRLSSRCSSNCYGSISGVKRVCVLASSSRGGTSVTAEFLQWQGADCDDPTGRILTLPGEEKPHLILAGLCFPMRPYLFDDLDGADAHQPAVCKLFAEMGSEVGYPMARCEDLKLYAMQLYRRLILQWPLHLSGLDPDAAIETLTDSLRRSFDDEYRDSAANRRQVLECCAECFPFIKRSFYDCSIVKREEDSAVLAGGAWSLEETPFVLPPPWNNATAEELASGTFLLRDPSNAWRLDFWKSAFSTQELLILHLMRDPKESIQGLCDGWNYPFGFQTLPSDSPLDIAGYSSGQIKATSEWKRFRLNFSIDQQLGERLLLERRSMTLVEVCGHQWREAHLRILADVERFSLHRVGVSFSVLREDPLATFTRICRSANLELSRSGTAYAQRFPFRRVMATNLALHGSHSRWRRSPHAGEILSAANEPESVELTRILESIPRTTPETGGRVPVPFWRERLHRYAHP